MDMEKIIKELHDARRYLEDKEWSDRGASPHIDAINDALALLKEQEARILQWDEIKDYPVVYGEFKGEADIYPLIITLDNFGRCLSWNPGINVSSEYLLLVSDEEDRKDTRCWNKMPTDEQRQAVKWE